jgi:NADH-quinone oxidoreductase subunit H
MNLHDIMYSNTWLTTLILLPGAIIFIIAMLGILEQPPINIPEAEQEIVYGFYTEYSGTNYVLLKFAEFTEILVVSAAAVTLFFGGYRGLFFDSFFCLFLKIVLIAIVMVAIRASNPRLRLDQMLKFAWSWLVPLTG